MNIFDAQIRSDTRSDDDLLNLAYFETTRVVSTAHAKSRFETARDLFTYFEGLIGPEVLRLERCGLKAGIGIGVLPDARPRRTHREVWERLPEYLQHENVVALGEVGVWEDTAKQWELFERQLKMALPLDLPVIVTPPAELRVNMTYKMMRSIIKVGLSPARVLINHVDATTISAVVAEGFVAGATAGPYCMQPRLAASTIHEFVEEVGSVERIVLDSSMRQGAVDILGVAKAVVSLQELGWSPEDLEAVSNGNAMALYYPETSSQSVEGSATTAGAGEG